MIGIYCIKNKLNGKCYIGQSIHIEERWKQHIQPSSDSVISNAIHKYGVENFEFTILQQCSQEELNKLENEYIQKFNSITPYGYNVIEYNDTTYTSFRNYDKDTFSNIVDDLLNSTLSFDEIAVKYNVDQSTVYRINQGSVHKISNTKYPLREVQLRIGHICGICGKSIDSNNTTGFCAKCYHTLTRKVDRPTREELKTMIRVTPFTRIGQRYNVSDNAVRKWCKSSNLPYKTHDILSLSDEQWNEI